VGLGAAFDGEEDLRLKDLLGRERDMSEQKKGRVLKGSSLSKSSVRGRWVKRRGERGGCAEGEKQKGSSSGTASAVLQKGADSQ